MEIENLPGERDRICQRPGGKAHGPVVSTGRDGQERATEANFWAFSCVDLFEAFQRCALAPTTATACHERAISEYLKFNRAG